MLGFTVMHALLQLKSEGLASAFGVRFPRCLM